jgi:2-polyprenyl-3-methyl-5-hydroxy-6-metoxy-1,4-benzoquinol methylase
MMERFRMVEPASAPQRRGLDEAYLQFVGYPDLGSLNRVKLIIEQVAIYAQKKQLERLRITDIGCGKGDISFPLLSLGHLVTFDKHLKEE